MEKLVITILVALVSARVGFNLKKCPPCDTPQDVCIKKKKVDAWQVQCPDGRVLMIPAKDETELNRLTYLRCMPRAK